jgi:hypothetical protein
MTPDEINVAIAEACGARIITKRFEDGHKGSRRYGKKWAWNGDESTPCAHAGGGAFGWGWNQEAGALELPNYHGSLDACAEMEATLTEDEWKDYCIPLGGRDTNWTGAKKLLSAKAPQRCEAFLRTKGLWK